MTKAKHPLLPACDISTLREFNCMECQGYLISKPIPLDKLADVMKHYGVAGANESVIKIKDWQKAG